jgi:hypothetical protein
MPRRWLAYEDEIGQFGRQAEPGDQLAGVNRRRLRPERLTVPELPPHWHITVSELASRGLMLAIIGVCDEYSPLVVPARAVPHLTTIERIAHEADNWEIVTLAALYDLLDEVGLGDARRVILDACRRGPAAGGARPYAAPGKPAAPPTRYRQSMAHQERVRAATKLSKLQRAILARVQSHGWTDAGVPIVALHGPGTWTRSRAACLSRALARLEERGLVTLIRTASGRVTHIRPDQGE